MGILKMSLPRTALLQSSREFLLSMVAILSKVFSSVPWRFIKIVGALGLMTKLVQHKEDLCKYGCQILSMH